MTTITFISPVTFNGSTPTLTYQPKTAAGDEPFILTECELREIVQLTVAACYECSDTLGAVADFWAVALLDQKPHMPAPTDIAAALHCGLEEVEALTFQVRDIARDVHEEETGLPAPW